MTFHRKTGSLITLSNESRTATRRYASTEFNNGIVLSSKPLVDNEVFEVKIEKRLNSWSGSIEVGVTMCNPDTVSLPTSATGLRDKTWIMSGCSVFMDGQSIKEDYGQDLDRLLEGHTLGVMRTSTGLLHFYINGEDQGIAANNVPQGIYAVVDIYGKCVQCSTTTTRLLDVNRGNVLANQLANEAIAEATALCSNVTLAFHEKCGSLVRLTHENRTAQRLRPTGEFNNGVVMTNRPLKPDELFEIRLDTMIDKWSGSIEVGITTHNPSLLDFPATMTNMRSGTIMMSGSGILTNGKGTQREYGQFNLDELAEGDRIGLIRKSNGSLHFFINGIDQGVAAVSAPEVVWGVVDLYGMAVKVTILEYGQDPYTSDDDSISASAPLLLSTAPATPSAVRSEAEVYDAAESDTDSSDHSIDDNSETEKLTFHPICGSNVVVFNRNRSVRRHNAMDEFNYGVVLSNRPLKPGEVFDIRIDDVVEKWAGSVEIGVTTFDPLTLDFPATMTNCRQGTWMMTGNGIIHNGVTVVEDYEENLDRVKTGDRVGVVRKEDGNLYFTLNGRNLGLAATNVPSNIYGVLDLYGQAAEASLVPAEGRDCVTVETSDIRFNQTYHGTNCIISPNGRSASRPRPREEFNESVVISNRPIRHNEIFEVIIEKTVDRWNGSLEIGVTSQPPEEFFPQTLSEIENTWRQNVWMLAGSSVVENGAVTRLNYPLDLDTLDKGSKIGLIVTNDGALHYLYNCIDYGPACQALPQPLYVILEIYGTCSAVSITRNSGMIISMDRPIRSSELRRAANKNHSKPTNQTSANSGNNSSNESKKAGLVRFSECCGKNIQLSHNNTTAQRHRSFNHGVVFSSDPIKPGELFEVRVDEMSRQWSGNLIIGFTTLVVSDNEPTAVRQSTALELQKNKSTWLISGNKVLLNGEVIQENYSNTDILDSSSRIGIKRESDSTMHLYIDGVDQGVAASGIPKNVFAVLDIYGSVESVSLINHSKNIKKTAADNSKLPEQNPSREIFDIDTSLYEDYAFSKISGCNIELFNKSMTARRTAGFNKALLISEQPLSINKPITLKIDELNKKWKSSLSVGLIDCKPENTPTSTSLTSVKQNVLSYCKSTQIYMKNNQQVNLGVNLDSLQEGDKIKLTIDHSRQVHLHINGIERGVIYRNVSDLVYCVVDLYGRCVQISVCKEDGECRESSDDKEKADDDTSMKEKVSHPVPLYCEYQQACERFKHCISLPEEFFKSKFNKCYCESCHKIRAGPDIKLTGNPQREYSVPIGWCRFALRVKPRAKALRIFETWNVAYCGLKLESVRRVLDCADLLALADSLSESRSSILGTEEERHDEKPETFESVPVILSPSIKYAGIHYFTQPIEYHDAKTQKAYKVKLAFQSCIKPNSYNIGPPTLDSSADTGLKSADVEWATKERGSVEIYGLLIRLEP